MDITVTADPTNTQVTVTLTGEPAKIAHVLAYGFDLARLKDFSAAMDAEMARVALKTRI